MDRNAAGHTEPREVDVEAVGVEGHVNISEECCTPWWSMRRTRYFLKRCILTSVCSISCNICALFDIAGSNPRTLFSVGRR